LTAPVLGTQLLPKQLRILFFFPAPFVFEIRSIANLFAKKTDGFLSIPVYLVSFAIVLLYEVG
jgi:hypothetical protein